MPPEKFISLSRRTIIRVVAALLIALYETLHLTGHIPDKVHGGLTVALLLLLIEQAVEINLDLGAISDEEGESARIVKFLSKDHGIFNDLMLNVHGELSRALKLHGESFTVLSPALAIHSYADFWKLLIKEQEQRGPSKPLTVEAIHSCEMDIWKPDHPLAPLLYDRQKRFILAGGRIERVLCGRGREPGKEFWIAYDRMREIKIGVHYYNIDAELVNHAFGWDFLRVAGSRQVVIWDSISRGPGGVISEAVYLNSLTYQDTEIDELWKEILDNSSPFESFKRPNGKVPGGIGGVLGDVQVAG